MNRMHNPPHPGEVLQEWLGATARNPLERTALKHGAHPPSR